jgi:hypothetical protein
MVAQTVKLGRRKFVIVPEADFRRLQQQAEQVTVQDKGDIAESVRRRARGPSRPYQELRRKLGLK